MPDGILISELYGPVIQGEGPIQGRVSHFIRTSGCPYRCKWCDSMHAVDPLQIQEKSRSMMPSEIVEQIAAMPRAPWITLTGGDPVAWDLNELIEGLWKYHFKVTVETQGSLWNDWLEKVDLVTCSPKPPSSGMVDKLDVAMLRKYDARLGHKLVFKIVAFTGPDLDFVERIHKAFPATRLFISSGTPDGVFTNLIPAVLEGYREIVEAVLERPALLDATISCQQHVLLYGRELGR